MEKVFVTERVASILEKVSTLNINKANVVRKVARFLNEVHDTVASTTQEFFDENNLSLVDVENAFRYGYAIKYEPKAGDVVLNIVSGTLVHVTETSHLEANRHLDSWSSAEFVKNHADRYRLVCKAENREDV